MNIIDRLLIDEYWVGHTDDWNIPGTEDLKPYISAQEKKRKWRLARMKELENNPIQRKIFDKFCHARKVGWKIIRNLDCGYIDSFSNEVKNSGGKIIIHKKN